MLWLCLPSYKLQPVQGLHVKEESFDQLLQITNFSQRFLPECIFFCCCPVVLFAQ